MNGQSRGLRTNASITALEMFAEALLVKLVDMEILSAEHAREVVHDAIRRIADVEEVSNDPDHLEVLELARKDLQTMLLSLP